MDKCGMKRRLLQLIRESIPFSQSARVNCLMNIEIDSCSEVLHFAVLEELEVDKSSSSSNSNISCDTNNASSNISSSNSSRTKKSKRKSLAPQKLQVVRAPNPKEELLSSSSEQQPLNLTQAAPLTQQQSKIKVEAGVHGKDQVFKTPLPQPRSVAHKQKQQQQQQQHQQQQQQASVFPTPIPIIAAEQQQSNGSAVSLMNIYNNGIHAASQQQQQHKKFLPAASPGIAGNEQPAGAAAEAAAAAAAAAAVKAAVANGKKLPIAPSSSARRSRQLNLRSRRGANKSFPCNQCHEVFTSLSQLSQHTYCVHKCYKCTFCGSNFTQRSNLQRHSLKHVGFKPFACRCCHKSYYRKDHLVRHIEVTHPGNDPKLSIHTRLSSAECLEFLERKQDAGEAGERAEPTGMESSSKSPAGAQNQLNSSASDPVKMKMEKQNGELNEEKVEKEEEVMMEQKAEETVRESEQEPGLDKEALGSEEEMEEEEDGEEDGGRMQIDADFETDLSELHPDVSPAAPAGMATVSVQVQADDDKVGDDEVKGNL